MKVIEKSESTILSHRMVVHERNKLTGDKISSNAKD